MIYVLVLSIAALGALVALIIIARRNQKSGGVIETRVELEPLPEPQLRENRVNRKDTYNFTLDVESFVRICMSDPSVRDMVFSAIKKGPMLPTEVLGACNMKDGEVEDNWFSVFAGTSRDRIAGQKGFVLRNKGGEGSRVSLRLKRQSAKTHSAQIPTEVTPAEVLPEAGNPAANLLRDAINGDKEAAAAFLNLADGAQPTEQPPPVEGVTLKL